ncbi:hypothetical protein GUM07_03855 [Listeria monocytogenes]|nr:hypothetical protein [Listeria monocytogenes]
MVDDFKLIESSFLQCYGLRLRKELSKMTFAEFINYLNGLSGETPFMMTIEIRATDKSKLPEHLRVEKVRQNRIMFKRGYFGSAADGSAGLERHLNQMSKKEG